VPKASKAQSFEEILEARFPQAPDLAVERIFAGRTIFFDTKHNRPLYPKDVIKAALYLAQYYVHQAGLRLVMTEAEKNFLQKTFGPLLALSFSVALLLPSLYDHFQ
jgi:hypothetical protein